MSEIEIIDKRTNEIEKVSKDFKIKYTNQLITIREIEHITRMDVNGIIYQLDGTIDICLRWK